MFKIKNKILRTVKENQRGKIKGDYIAYTKD
jgi:hypothetical protein